MIPSRNCLSLRFVTPNRMKHLYDWAWLEAEVARTMDVWNECASLRTSHAEVRFTTAEQQVREKAYDAELLIVEREARRSARTRAERIAVQSRIEASFARFAGSALGLEPEAVELLLLPIACAVNHKISIFHHGGSTINSFPLRDCVVMSS